ncbi:MAG: DNA recombination protein RmuC, partial [Chitinophagaceae bacterium]
MSLTEILLITAVLLLVITIILQLRNKSGDSAVPLQKELGTISNDIARIDPLLRNEFALSREELNRQSRDGRQELATVLANVTEQLSKNVAELGNSQKQQLETFSGFLQNFTKGNEDRFEKLIASNETKQGEFRNQFAESVKDFNELQRQKFNDLLFKQEQTKNDTEGKLDKIRETVENKLKSLQEDNHTKLEQMRVTVDEKLQGTLEKRFNESFTVISERLELVHKGLGEMQNLATSVGDIKKVMSNVKSRGVLGEYQLHN